MSNVTDLDAYRAERARQRDAQLFAATVRPPERPRVRAADLHDAIARARAALDAARYRYAAQDRLIRRLQAMQRLLGEIASGWQHACTDNPVAPGQPLTVVNPHGQPCPHCGATEPTPPEAA